ncbi:MULTISPECIES: hypothetical protein [Saccharothrix]|uniref:hypothetical protein n=1 Tax=Saccharothrix TaxID=2071 RepID=UPI00093EC86C|nr:hypothetical protein [Saccharothrix sp. CB00851]OKI38804.1 hypothetical protein A6A25_00915 [Saccharothrix sp. CB00851]
MTIDLRDSTDFEVLRAAKVLARIAQVAGEAGVAFLVVGAMARTITSIGLLGTSPERQTRDIDIATEVDSWGEFEHLARKLDGRKGVHKFVVMDTEVDVMPYGGVERADRTILWPDDYEMNVLGLREAVESAETALLPGEVSVRVPSIPALALLEELDLLERFDYDPSRAGAWLLGAHMSELLGDEDVSALLDLAGNADLMARLARDMAVVRASALVGAMCDGIRDAVAERPEGR